MNLNKLFWLYTISGAVFLHHGLDTEDWWPTVVGTLFMVLGCVIPNRAEKEE